MPNLFTLPGPRGGANNFLSHTLFGARQTISLDAGTTYYASLDADVLGRP